MDLKNSDTAFEVGEANLHTAIETTWTQEGRVKDVGTVSSSKDNDASVALETVHLGQNLVQGLLALIVATRDTGSTLTADGINLINEDDARSVLLRHVKEITDTRSTNTNKELNEFRTGGRDEGNSSLSSGGTSEQGLTSTRRTLHNDTLRNLCSELSELLRVLEEFHDLLKFLLGLVVTGNLIEGYSSIGLHLDLGAGTSELGRVDTTKRSAPSTASLSTALVSSGKKEADDSEDDDGDHNRTSKVEQRVRLLVLCGEDGNLNVVLAEDLKEVKGDGDVGKTVEAALLVDGASSSSILGQRDLLNLIVDNSVHQFKVAELLLLRQHEVR
mmetsp:Transcript_31319/g.50291  ORF Transcript_31319/g.50291 Transcript_31319/m.50291 type:complete len:330 (-) Transcript_31319:441-1430(-)